MATTPESTAGPVLIEIDGPSWKGHLYRVEVWLAHTVGAQVEFRGSAPGEPGSGFRPAPA